MLCVATSLLFSVIVFFGCNFQGNFWVFASVYYLTSMVGITLAYAVAALVPTMDAANAALPVAVTMWLYFGTFFITTSEMPDYAAWFSWTSFLRYAWGALLNNQFRDTASGEAPIFFGNENRSSPSQADGMLAYGGGAWGEGQAGCAPPPPPGVNVLEFYSISGPVMGSAGACIGLLALLLLIFSTCGWCAVQFVRHDTR